MSALLDRIAATATRHERLIAIIGGVWLFASWASYAGFVDLPEIPFITDRMAIFVSTGVNGVWWGFLRPAIEQRKQASIAPDVAVVESDR